MTLNREVLDGKMVFPVVGQALVERAVLFCSDVRWVTSPNGFRLVELLLGGRYLLDLFSFFLLLVLLFVVDFLNLGLPFFVFSFFVFPFFLLVIVYFLRRPLSTATYDSYA